MEMDQQTTERTETTRRRRGPVRRFVRFAFYALLVVGAIFLGGFLYFADVVAALQPPDRPKADAIVVLTGGFQRIDQAVELLKSGAGERLLISGVNPSTSGSQIRRNTQTPRDLFDCCVDIGRQAIDTIGNANETARWARGRGYGRVLVVTNNYHMPRSLLELRRAAPDIEFIAFPVVNSDLKTSNWLSNPMALKTILLEYIKTVAATVRDALGAGRSNGLRADLGGTGT